MRDGAGIDDVEVCRPIEWHFGEALLLQGKGDRLRVGGVQFAAEGVDRERRASRIVRRYVAHGDGVETDERNRDGRVIALVMVEVFDCQRLRHPSP